MKMLRANLLTPVQGCSEWAILVSTVGPLPPPEVFVKTRLHLTSTNTQLCFSSFFRVFASRISPHIFIFIILCISLVLVILGSVATQAFFFSSCGEQELLSSCVLVSHYGGFCCCEAQAPGHSGFSSGLRSCGSRL